MGGRECCHLSRCPGACGRMEEAQGGGCLPPFSPLWGCAVGGVGGVVYNRMGPGPYQGVPGVAAGSDPAELWDHVGAPLPTVPQHGAMALLLLAAILALLCPSVVSAPCRGSGCPLAGIFGSGEFPLLCFGCLAGHLCP